MLAPAGVLARAARPARLHRRRRRDALRPLGRDHRSEPRLACEAILAAAGVDPHAIDGLTSFADDRNEAVFLARDLGRLVDVDPAAVRVGMAVEVVWEDAGPGLALPRFRVVA